MSAGAKIAIVILIVLAVLFVTGVGVGFTRDDDSGSADPANPGALVDWAVGVFTPRETFVGGSDFLSSSCFDGGSSQFTIPPGATCNTIVRASDTHIRTLKLTLTLGRKMRVVLESRGKDQFTAKLPLRSDSNKMSKLLVREEGATLALTCDEPEVGAPLPLCMVALGSK